MKYGSTNNLLIFILQLFLFIRNAWTDDGSCVFPESEIEPFFFDLLSNTPADSIVVDTVVEPPDAKIQIANIRSNNIPNINFADYFEIETRSRNGQFLLVTRKPLQLPNFPSSIGETLLYTTVNCNGKFFPLITIRVRSSNNRPPKFYNEPYEITVLKNSLIGSQYLTSILAVDADPSERYDLKYSVQTNKEQFSLVTEPQRSYKILGSLPEEEYSRDENEWALEQLPHFVYLKVLTHLARPVYYLNISVTDNGLPKAKEAYAQLKVVVRSVNEIQARFSQPEYFANFTKDFEVNIDLIPNQQIYATFPTPSNGNSNGPIVYELVPTKYSDLIMVDPLTARIRLARPIIETDLPPNIPLRLRAFPQNNPQNFVEATLTLNDMTEVKLTYFAQCHYEAHLLENPSTYTKVLQFNYKGDVDQIELLNGTEYFEVDSDGTMLVKYGVDIDRETMDHITVKARLKSHFSFHPKSLELCQIATANIFIDDLNDHTPKFEKLAYTFYIDLLPYNNTEVGILRAVDEDKGEFGQVKYRILIDEHESLPFILFQADGAATIYYVTRENFYPERSYTFAVEAYDADSDPRTSRISVHVVLESEAEMRQRQRDEESMKREKEIEAANQHQQEWGTTVSNSQDAAVNSFTINEGDERIASADSDEGSPFAVEHGRKATSGYHRRQPIPAKYDNHEKAERRRVHHARQLQVDQDSSTEPILEKYLSSQEKLVNRQPIEIEQPFVATTTVSQSPGSEYISETTRPNAIVPSKIFLKQLDLAVAAAKSSRTIGTRKGQKLTSSFIDVTYSTTIPSSPLAESGTNDSDVITSTSTAFFSSSLSLREEANFDSSNAKLRFSQQNYTFWLKGRLDIGDYIGMVHLSPLLYGFSDQSSDDDSSAEAVSDLSSNKALLKDVEFSVEEGILGFVDIDRFNGKLTVGRKLVEDSYEEIRFSVAALDSDSKILATTLVTVLMDDVASIYDANPVFEQAFYAFDFDENQVVERFGKVEAHHKAVDSNRDRLWYVLDRKLPDTAHFRVDPETGWLSNRAALDAEQRRRYNIKVSACLESNTTSCGFTEVVILVRDVNDNAPEFNRSLFDVTIPLNLPADTELIRLTAVDADMGKNAEIEYSLRAPGSFQELFEVNSKTGVVSLAKRLGTTMENVAEGLHYRIDIDAIDHGSPPMSSSTSLIFRTANVNPSSPVFDKFRYEVTMDSPIPPDVEIVRVHAVDLDPGFDGKVQYQFSDLDELANVNIAKQFAIDPQQGLITAITRVDPPISSVVSPPGGSEDETDNYRQSHDYTIQLVVEAIDQSRVFPRRSQTVVVIQLNPSKTSPKPIEIEFIPLPKTVFISTAKPAGTNILKVSVRPKDGEMLAADDQVEYSVVDPITQFFQIRDGQLVVEKRLEPGEHEVTIRATRSPAHGAEDASGSTFIEHHLRVVVMKNRDKYPVFERLNYDAQIDSDAQFPLKIPSLNATLLNGQILYTIPAVVTDNYTNNSNSGIVIDKITGDITIFEECVKALATKGVHKIEHFLLVRATNAHFSKFFSDATIRLVIVNRNNPEFVFDSQLYRYIVPENYPIGSIIGDSSLAFRIRQPTKASSRSDDTRYFFQPPSDVFGVLANGSIILMRHLDLEKLVDVVDTNGVLDLNVMAESGEDKTNAKVQIAIVDENEFTPHFERPKYLFVLATAGTSEVIGRMAATDADFSDRDNLKYRGVFGSALEFLEVLENGTIVRKGSQRDLKSGSINELLIEVTDSANHTDRTVVQFVVDASLTSTDRLHFVDDPSGIINVDLNQLEKIVRKSAVEMPIYCMMAIANASVDTTILYSIGDDEPSRSLFRIDSASGQLFYLLNADHIAANSQRPQELELLVEASSPNGDAVRKVYTIRFGVDKQHQGDKDGVQTSSLTDASTISSTTVEFRLSSSTEEDSLTSLNFASNEFKFLIRNPKRDQLVGQLTLLPSRPSHLPPLQMFIEPPPFRNWFLLDPRTSLLFIRQVPGNLTGRQRAEFRIVAYESNRPQQRAECNITVDLVLPGTIVPIAIPMPIRDGEMIEPSPTNNEFTANDDILSNDEDAQMVSIPFGDGQKLASTTHQQTTPSPPMSSFSRFTISTGPDETPELLATTTVGMEANGEETLERLSTTALPLASRRTDDEESDGKFRFPYELYTAVLPEGMYGNRGATATLHPQSLRQDMPTGTTYFMDASADLSLPFHIRNDTGELIAFANIDREKVSRYEFHVRAIHPSDERQRALARIQIDILDVNDNYPIFVDAAAAIAVNTLTPPSTVLATLIAVDVDEGDAGRVSYRLEENPHELFEVALKTGELILTNSLPVELNENVFYVTVTAMDGGRPALKTSHRIRIEVFADSIDRPTFKQQEYSADVLLAESTTIGAKAIGHNGTFIAQVLAGTGPLHYELNDPSSDLFRVDDNGVVRLGRTPMESELNRRYTLNVTARRVTDVVSENEELASTLVNVYLEKPSPTTVAALSSTTVSPLADLANTDEVSTNSEQCGFDRKTYFAEIRENTAGKHRLTTLKTRNCDGVKLRFSLNDTRNENFEVDETTGDFYVLRELDRERKSMHFVAVNVSIVDTSRLVRREVTASAVSSLNPIVEYMKNRLAENQALVSVRVLDENDNPPTFARLNSQGVYVFVVDWQAPVLQPIARVEATDLDERSKLNYSLKHTSSDDFFEINATSGVIALQRPLVGISQEQFHMEVAASDGVHDVRAPLQIHKLELGVNVVILTSDRPADQVDERIMERQLSKALELSAHVLVKQIFTDEDGRPDKQRTHLVMYALDRLTRVPADAATLKTLLDKKLPDWRNSSSSTELEHLTGVTLPIISRTFAFTWINAILYAVSFALLLTVCCLVFLLLRCCKRQQALAKSDMEYMVNSEYAGPRPYNVELITRKMAQNILAARPLPDPHEEVTMSPESRATMIASSGIYNVNQAGIISSNNSNSRMESSDDYSTNNITVTHQHDPQNSGFDSSSEQQARAKLRSIPSITIGSTMA